MLLSPPVSAPLLHIREPIPAAVPEAEWGPKLSALRGWLGAHDRVVVAYSGGVDSSVVLRVAHDVIGSRAIGVIGRSDSYARRELDMALDQAAEFGARVEVVTTG